MANYYIGTSIIYLFTSAAHLLTWAIIASSVGLTVVMLGVFAIVQLSAIGGFIAFSVLYQKSLQE